MSVFGSYSPRSTGADELDAFVFSAEAGSAWTLRYPQFSVVVPQPDIFVVPLAYPVADYDERFAQFLNT